MSARRRRRGVAWARARDALYQALSAAAGADAEVEVGRVRKIGEGLYRRAFFADVAVAPDPGALSGGHVALVSRESSDDERRRGRRETAVLRALAGCSLPFEVPRVVALIEEEDAGSVLIETPLRGSELDLRAGRQGAVEPWAVVGELAAAIHALDPAPFSELLGGCVTWRADALGALESAWEGLEHPVVEDAKAWALSHLPPEAPCVLLHGDLLGQNIRLPWDGAGRRGVIDWSLARIGAPAYDLAIVTRGARRPFQHRGGLARLLERYHACGGHEGVTAQQVHLFELCLALRWYRDALDPERRSHPPEEELKRLRGVLGRAARGGR